MQVTGEKRKSVSTVVDCNGPSDPRYVTVHISIFLFRCAIDRFWLQLKFYMVVDDNVNSPKIF
jgi:hypothetical protein